MMVNDNCFIHVLQYNLDYPDPLATALMLAYRISEIVWITKALSFLTGYTVPSH